MMNNNNNCNERLEKAINHPWQKFGGLSYAQEGEDFLIMNLFANIGKEHFSYLDVGAHDPYVISNTALLYQRGCRGYNVEADVERYQDFVLQRPLDTNINIGVGTANGKKILYRVGEISSFVLEEVLFWKNKWGGSEEIYEIEVEVMTLSDIVKNYCNGVFPEYMTIDIEGLDYDVINSCDFMNTKPMVITVEVAQRPYTDLNPEKMVKMLAGKGYSPAVRFNSNITFIANDFFEKAVLGM